MKEKYFRPTTDVEEFRTIDVITTSDLRDDDNVVDGSGGWDD